MKWIPNRIVTYTCIILLSFNSGLSIIAKSLSPVWLNVVQLHFFLMACLLCCTLSCWIWVSFSVISYMLCIDMLVGMPVDVQMAFMLIFMPVISSSFFSVCSCLGSQSAMNRSGPHLYIMPILCWCILNSMNCTPCDWAAMSFLTDLGKCQLSICNWALASSSCIVIIVYVEKFWLLH